MLDFSNYDMDIWLQFLQEKWFVLLIAVIVLYLIVKIVKTVVKWAIVLVIVIGLIYYSGYSLDELKQLGTDVTDNVKQDVISSLLGDISEAEYKQEKDGTYTITSKNVKLIGKKGESQVEVRLHGASLGKWELDKTLKNIIQQIQNNK